MRGSTKVAREVRVKIHRLEREQFVPRSIEELFPFFSDARNLEIITPGWVHFGMLPPIPESVEQGTLLYYRLRLAGVPFRWRTCIREWDPPRGFVDVQERGPFSLWEHHHAFRVIEGGVLMRDVIRYAVPLGPLGGVVHGAVLRGVLSAIFDYRYARIAELFESRPGYP